MVTGKNRCLHVCLNSISIGLNVIIVDFLMFKRLRTISLLYELVNLFFSGDFNFNHSDFLTNYVSTRYRYMRLLSDV